MQTCLLSIIHVYILPSLPTIKQSNNQRKCKQAFKGTSVKKNKRLCLIEIKHTDNHIYVIIGLQRTKQSNIQSYMYSCMQANIENRNVKKLQKTKKHVIKHTSLQTNLKDIKDIWYACKFSNIQTHKQSKVKTYKQKK